MAFTGASTMWQAVVIFFLSIFTAAGFALGGGVVLDVVYNEFAAVGIFSVPAEWGNFDTYRYLMNLYYAMCCILPVVGIYYLGVTIYHKYIIEDDDGEEYHYSGSQI